MDIRGHSAPKMQMFKTFQLEKRQTGANSWANQMSLAEIGADAMKENSFKRSFTGGDNSSRVKAPTAATVINNSQQQIPDRSLTL